MTGSAYARPVFVTLRHVLPYDDIGNVPKLILGGIKLENNHSQNRPVNGGCSAGKGTLPSCAPLANPYVPFQMRNPEQYQPAKGMVRGTMFPGLDLPFMGMVNNTEKNRTLKHQIQSLSFAMTELGLYLDTHKEDKEALELFNSYKELYDELIAEYESKYGPLTQMEAGRDGVYSWLDNPWPWDIAAQEG